MRQAITTKFLGPTDNRGSRVKAQAAAGSLTVNWDHRLSAADNHRAAARKLATKLGWTGTWLGGGLPNEGTVFVCADVHADSFEVAETVEA